MNYFAKFRRFITAFLMPSLMMLGSLTFSYVVNADQHAKQLQEQQKAPELVVRDTVDAVIENIQTNRAVYEQDINALYAMLDETLVPALHIPRMSKIILGKKVAKSSTEEQKAAFAEEFKTLLMRTYAAALLEFTGEQKVQYGDVRYKPSGDIAVVEGAFIATDGEKYDIILHMSNRDDTQWRAYNMEAVGINVISTYRTTFGPILAKKGIDGLIADLRKKNS